MHIEAVWQSGSGGIEISLIMATYGRKAEVRAFLDSVVMQEVPSDSFELIVVDQNECIDLGPLLHEFSHLLQIKHIRSQKKGLSHNRNLGLRCAQGRYVAFPDDDCEYYPDTLATMLRCAANQSDADIIHGRIFDRKCCRNVMRLWPDKPGIVNIHNSYFFGSSIALFAKNAEGIYFDSQFGIGARYGGYEDVELVIRNVRLGRKVIYDPAIQVTHPELNGAVMPRDKVFNYGVGFGAMCRKHLSLPVVYLFCKSIGYHFLQAGKSVMFLDCEKAVKGMTAIASRVRGFLSYSPTSE